MRLLDASRVLTFVSAFDAKGSGLGGGGSRCFREAGLEELWACETQDRLVGLCVRDK